MDISEVCGLVRNYFVRTEDDIKGGVYTIENGALDLSSFLKPGQYFRITGSVFNDGVYKYGEAVLTDETFKGEVWAMSPPPAFIRLVDQITEWNRTNENTIRSPFTSESFGGYSYTKSNGSNGEVLSWKDVFASELSKWRKVTTL